MIYYDTTQRGLVLARIYLCT